METSLVGDSPLNRQVWVALAMLVALSSGTLVTSAGEAVSTVSVTIVGFESDHGQVMVALWDDAERFPMDDGYVASVTGRIESGKAFIEFSAVSPGDYAISVFHDENGNGELDTRFMGIPKEPIGASNDAKGRFGPPKFEDARFPVGVRPVELTIHLQNL